VLIVIKFLVYGCAIISSLPSSAWQASNRFIGVPFVTITCGNQRLRQPNGENNSRKYAMDYLANKNK
jgi:hypothetical protein